MSTSFFVFADSERPISFHQNFHPYNNYFKKDLPVIVMAVLELSTSRPYDSCPLGDCRPLLVGTETSPVTSLITLFSFNDVDTGSFSLSVTKKD